MNFFRKLYHKIFRRRIEYKKYINNLLQETREIVTTSQNQLINIMQKVNEQQNELQQLKIEFSKVNLELLSIKENSDILIVGFYGAPNLGDELMLSTLLLYLDCNKYNITVMLCDNYEYSVANYPKVHFIHYPKTRYDFNTLAEKFDTIIFGGGAIIDDVPFSRKDSFKTDLGTILIELSMRGIAFHKKMIYLGLSSNTKLENQEYIYRLEYIINHASYFSVRDTNSKQTLLEHLPNLNQNKIKVIDDLVLANQNLVSIPKDKEQTQNTIGIIWICTTEEMNDLKILLQKLKDKSPKCKIKLIPFYDYVHNDYNLYQQLLTEVKDRENIELLPYYNTIENIIKIFDSCNSIISMRYHATLISLARNINTISICYDKHPHYLNKITYINKEFNNNQLIFLSALRKDEKEYDKLIEYLNSQKSNDNPIPKLITAQEKLQQIIKKEVSTK